MSEYWNPFDAYRPELTEDPILDYFVAPDFLPDLIGSRKSIVIVGGRGTGKTTLLRYLSYESQKIVCSNLEGNYLSQMKSIGVYWRANTNYVTAFQGSQLDDAEWSKAFAHYINIVICKKMCEIVLDIGLHYSFHYEEEICQAMGKVFYDSSIRSFRGLIEFLSDKQLEIEKYVNNIGRVNEPIWSIPERAHSTFSHELVKEPALENKWFFFLIDEYENLAEYQQRVINTYIKHAEVPYSFKICRRVYGDKTNQTLSDSEFLSETDDWSTLDLNTELRPKFADFVKNVCRKRLEKHPVLSERGLTNIDYFLPGLSIKEECARIEKAKSGFIPYRGRLEAIIFNETGLSQGLKDQILSDVLGCSDPLLRRLFLCLIERRGNKVVDVYQEYLNYVSGKPSKFKEGQWIHNNELGVLFLLASEYSVQKLYCGFDVFILLSAGNIRDFLDLCSATFRFAMREGYELGDAQPIPFDVQNIAARHIAQKHLIEIAKNQPYGEILRDFTLALGGIFEYFHRDTKQSEPEKNQFTVDATGLTSQTREILYKAVMADILLEFRGTKYKSKSELKISDFMLHPIFSPYFRISYTKGRKLSLAPGQLELLIKGSKVEKDGVIRSVTKGESRAPSKVEQTTLFDFIDGGDSIE